VPELKRHKGRYLLPALPAINKLARGVQAIQKRLEMKRVLNTPHEEIFIDRDSELTYTFL
jgi:hypothetical protein